MSGGSSRSVYRQRRVVVLGIVSLVLIAILYVIAVLAAPVPLLTPITAKRVSVQQPAAAIDWAGSGSGALAEVGRKDLLATTGSDASVPTASMAKTITALVILDRKPIAAGSEGPTITFTQKDVQILAEVKARGGSWANVDAGEQLTEREALEAMLLPSANNYAISLATWAYGSVDAYLRAANAWLAEHGYDGTHQTDPAGLDPGTVSTPTELVSIGERLLADPVLADVVATAAVTLPGAGTQKNGNRLLGSEGVTGTVDGIKTGYTPQAGHCLLFSTDLHVGGRTIGVVGVVLGQPSYDALFAAVRGVLASARDGYHDITLVTDGDRFGGFTTAWGTKEQIVAASTSKQVVWSDARVMTRISMKPVGLAAAGTPVGTATYTVEGRTTTVDLVTKTAVVDPGVWWRLVHPFGLNDG